MGRSGREFWEIESELLAWACDDNVVRHVIGAIEYLQNHKGREHDPRSQDEDVDLEDFAGPKFHPGVDDSDDDEDEKDHEDYIHAGANDLGTYDLGSYSDDDDAEEDAWWEEQIRLGKGETHPQSALAGLNTFTVSGGIGTKYRNAVLP